ncbi:MAG: hypothetical protein ACXAC5_05160 [Promethearchaeota archaeon]|jgi:hypothetical protein
MGLWRTWQFPAYGCVASLISDDDRKIVEPPDQILTRRLFILTVFILIVAVSEYLIRTIWAKRKGREEKLDEDAPSVFDSLIGQYKEPVGEWAEEKGFIDVEPTFYEEYLFYKYYYKIGKYLYDKEAIKYLPGELGKLANQSKKDYLVFRLAGLKE